MDILLDTCLVLMGEKNQSKVPSFKYECLDKILKDSNNKLFISPFSIPELWTIKKYSDVDDLVTDLAKKDLRVAPYNLSQLKADFSGYDLVNKYAAAMFYHLTEFLEFFVLEVISQLGFKDITECKRVILEGSDSYYLKNKVNNLMMCTIFMKTKAVEYIEYCISHVLKHFGISFSNRQIWKLIGDTTIGTFLSRDVCNGYIRYGRYLTKLFKAKYINKATKIRLSFSFNDLLVAHASEYGYVVVSSDFEINKYLARYGNEDNKKVVEKLWEIEVPKIGM